jgi:uncharacterized protein (DUF111 family)
MELTERIKYAKHLSEQLLNKQSVTVHYVRRVSKETLSLSGQTPPISIPKYKATSKKINEVRVEVGHIRIKVAGESHFDINLGSDIEFYDTRELAEQAAKEKMLDIYAEIIDKLKEKYKQLEE